jgi:hypothetical protein
LIGSDPILFKFLFPTSRAAAPSKNELSNSNSPQWKKWLPWTLALSGILVGGYLIHQREQHIRQLNGLKVNF